jgi:hypothetical protein
MSGNMEFLAGLKAMKQASQNTAMAYFAANLSESEEDNSTLVMGIGVRMLVDAAVINIAGALSVLLGFEVENVRKWTDKNEEKFLELGLEQLKNVKYVAAVNDMTIGHHEIKQYRSGEKKLPRETVEFCQSTFQQAEFALSRKLAAMYLQEHVQ